MTVSFSGIAIYPHLLFSIFPNTGTCCCDIWKLVKYQAAKHTHRSAGRCCVSELLSFSASACAYTATNAPYFCHHHFDSSSFLYRSISDIRSYIHDPAAASARACPPFQPHVPALLQKCRNNCVKSCKKRRFCIDIRRNLW